LKEASDFLAGKEKMQSIFHVFLLHYSNTRESLKEQGKAVETLDCTLCGLTAVFLAWAEASICVPT